MSKLRGSLLVAAVLAGLLLILSILNGLATNVASSTRHWPGPLDLIRRYPWWTVLVLGALTVLLTVLAVVISGSGPTPASSEDLLATEERLREHLDKVETRRSDVEDRAARLPPYPRALLAAAGEDRDLIWKVIAPFTDDAVVPRDLAREWAVSPPAAIDGLPITGRLVVAELLLGYGQPAAAVEHLRKAVDWGATPRAYWLVRMAQVQMTPGEDDPAPVDRLLAEAEQVEAAYPLVAAMKSFVVEDWNQTVRALEGWNPPTFWEHETAVIFRYAALLSMDKLDEAIIALDSGPSEFRSASILLQLAQLLRTRAVQGTGDSGIADATRAVEIAIRARNMRRLWRSDSAEAVAVAAEAAVVADDHQQVWALTRPAPDGEATPSEAADSRVLPVAAMGAVLTGRFAQARELIDSAPDGYVRLCIEAELASADPSHIGSPTAVEAWRATLRAAATDEEKLRTLRRLAMEGASDRAVLEGLKARYPQAAAEIETLSTIASVSGPDADERLRALETRSPLASVRRAELLRHDDPEGAAELLIDANTRWRNPRLLLLALDCYQDAGRWEQADRVAQDALAQIGPQWSGRATVMRRLADIQSARNDWPKVEMTCRALLEIDQNDEGARWALAHAQYRGGDPQQAWQTFKRAAALPNVITPVQARLLLDLSRRYADAVEVARTALAMLHAFPDDQDVHAAVIGSVTLRFDRTELPEDIGSEVTVAWQSFFERYPDSERFTAYTIHDDNPLADIEEQIRQQARTYREVEDRIRDQNHPIGMLEVVAGKPYSAIFSYRPLGYHRVAFPGDQDNALELDLARASLAGNCLVDASALYTLALLPDVAPTLIALLSRPAITDIALRDLVEADDMFGLPSEGTLSYDFGLGRVVAVGTDAEVADRQRTQIGSMLTTARGFRRIIHPALVHLQSIRPHREPTWTLTLDAAKHNGTSLWADDTGLRIVAHSMGIKTFSTQALLTIAHERQRIDDTTLNQTTRALIREYAVDLPYDHSALLEVGAEQNWEPRSVAVILSRAITWSNGPRALQLFRTAFRNSPDTGRKTWAYAALIGIRDATVPDDRAEKLTAFTAITLGDAWTRPEHASAVVAAIQALLPEETDALVHAALKRVWTGLKETYPTEHSVIVFLHIISRLDDDYRQYGAKLILE
jgi:tetratricopeptide (TPR) repeat protein